MYSQISVMPTFTVAEIGAEWQVLNSTCLIITVNVLNEEISYFYYGVLVSGMPAKMDLFSHLFKWSLRGGFPVFD